MLATSACTLPLTVTSTFEPLASSRMLPTSEVPLLLQVKPSESTITEDDLGTPSGDIHTEERRKKKPYKELTLQEKVQLIRLSEENAGMSQAAIAEKYSIAKSNVCRILQRKQEYLQAFETAGFAGSRKRKLKSVDLPTRSHSIFSNPIPEPVENLQISKPAPALPTLSNENLRAHMYKQHQISRMFMCRCCNWAFPDKTSLHIHVQQREEGKSMSSSTSLTSAVPTFEQRESAPSAFAPLSAKTIPTSLSQLQTTNVFPLPLFPSAPTSLVPSAEDLARLRERLMLNTLVNQQNFGLAAAWLNQLPKPIPTTHLPMPEVQKVDEDDIDVDKCDVVKVEEDSENKANISLAAELSASKLTNIILSVKRSDSPTENASSSSTSGSSPAHTSSAHSPTNLLKKEAHTPSAFHHLNVDSRGFFETVSPLNVSPAETHSSVSPADGCYECSLYKSKLNAAESKCRYLDTRATNLQSETARTQSQLNNFESTLRQSETEAKILRESNELLQRRLKECQEQAIRFLQSDRLANPQAISLFMNQLIQTTLLR